jgi:flagellar motor switch protein FliM
MPAGAAGLVASVLDAAPRVGLLLGMACGRTLPVSCPGVRRVALLEVTTAGLVWAPLSCGLPDPGIMLVPASAAVALADLFLGGLGEAEDRATTALEQQLLVHHVLPALKPLGEALAEHGVTVFTAGPATDKPLPVGGGEVVAVPLDIRLPLGTVVTVTLCLPAKSLLPADTDGVLAVPTSRTQQVLADVPVEVSLRLPGSTVSAEEVEDLHPGDVIRLDGRALEQLVGVLAGKDDDVTVLTAALGRRGKHRAVVVGSPYGGQ